VRGQGDLRAKEKRMDPFIKKRLASAEEMRELDRSTIEEFGIPGEVLMESAGKGVFEYLEDNYRYLQDALIVCGKGNNGGDGFVVGRYLLNRGVRVTAILLGRNKELKGDARLNLERFLKLEGKVIEVTDEKQLTRLKRIIEESELIIDAIFGTGLNSLVKGLPAKAIKLINEAHFNFGIPVIAIDIPSGINASTGEVMGEAVWADATITFGLAKLGHYTYPGADYVGDLKIVEIGIPARYCLDIETYLLDEEMATVFLKPRRADCHKGDNGHCVIFAGSTGKTGAAAMASESALRAGAGLVTLAVPASLNDIFEIKLTEVMTEPIEDEEKKFGRKSISQAKKFMEGKDAIALGPGIGSGKEMDEFVREILVSASVPVVVDADGLNSLARQKSIFKEIKAPLVLTPHPGEMSRLTGISVADVQKDRMGVAKKFAREWGAIVVLKGAGTVIADPEGIAFLNRSGNPAMASAGMGDVLTGIIAGLLSQHYGPLEASALGVFMHGMAGDLATKELGDAGIIATDVIRKIPAVRKSLLDMVFGLSE